MYDHHVPRWSLGSHNEIWVYNKQQCDQNSFYGAKSNNEGNHLDTGQLRMW